MWTYERKMPWEEGERKPFCKPPPPPKPHPVISGVDDSMPDPGPPTLAMTGAPEEARPPTAPPPTGAETPAVSSQPGVVPPAAPAPPATSLPRERKRSSRPRRGGKFARKRQKVKSTKPPDTSDIRNPFAGLSEEPKVAGPELAASFPEMEATKLSGPQKVEEEIRAEEAAASGGDPLLGAKGDEDEWDASDTFREKRRQLTHKHEIRQRMKLEDERGADEEKAVGDDALLSEREEAEGWSPSDSHRLAPIRGLEGLGAHDEDQFEDEEEEGLGTRVLAREADDMERDAVDEEFFSDIDLSIDEYAEASKAAVGEARHVARVVRKLEETQLLDYDDMAEKGIFDETEELDVSADPPESPMEEEDVDEEGLQVARSLTDLEFARALSRVPSRRLLRHVEGLTRRVAFPAEGVTGTEYEAIFGN